MSILSSQQHHQHQHQHHHPSYTMNGLPPPQQPPPPTPNSIGRGPPPQRPPTTGPPPPGYSIPPSHPSHPAHHQWLQQNGIAHSPGGPPPPLPPPPPPPGAMVHDGRPVYANGAPPIRINTNFNPMQQQQLQQQQHSQPNSALPPGHPGHHQQQQLPNGVGGPPPPPPPPPPRAGPGPRPPPPLHSSSFVGSPATYRPGSLPPTPQASQPPPLPPLPPPPPSSEPPGPGTPGAGGRPVMRSAAIAGGARAEAILGAQLAAAGIGPLTAQPTGLGPGLAKLSHFNESLALALETETLDALRNVVADHFTETGILKYGLHDRQNGLSKVFEIPCSAFPRFQHINSLSGVLTSSLQCPSFVREYVLTAPEPSTGRPVHVGYLLRADEATLSSRFANGTRVDLAGQLTAHFAVVGPGQGPAGAVATRIESLEFSSRHHEEWVIKEALVTERVERLWDDGTADDDDAAPPPPSHHHTRKQQQVGVATRRKSAAKEEEMLLEMNDSGDKGSTRGHKLPKATSPWPTERAKGLDGESVTFERQWLPKSGVGSFGITEMGMRCLEISESVGHLQDLVSYSLETNTGPLQSLHHFANMHRSSQPHPHPNAPPPSTPGGGPPQTPSALPPPLGPAPIASTSQNPHTNSFYATAPLSPGKRKHPGAGGGGGGGGGAAGGGLGEEDEMEEVGSPVKVGRGGRR